MAAAASRSRVRIADASRASPLIALISSSHARAARLDRFAGHGACPAVAEPRLGVVLGAPHRARIRSRGGRLGRGLVLVVGALRRPVGLIGDTGLLSCADRELAAFVREPAGLGARTVRARASRPVAGDGADGADGAEEAASSALPVGASRSAVVLCRPWAAAALIAVARSAVRVGSAPPEIGRGRRAGSWRGSALADAVGHRRITRRARTNRCSTFRAVRAPR